MSVLYPFECMSNLLDVTVLTLGVADDSLKFLHSKSHLLIFSPVAVSHILFSFFYCKMFIRNILTLKSAT